MAPRVDLDVLEKSLTIPPTDQTRIAQPVVQSLLRPGYLLSKSEYSVQYNAVKRQLTNNTVF